MADGRRHGHLRHHRGAAAADQALVQQQHVSAGPGGRNGGVHARSAGADDQHIGFEMDHEREYRPIRGLGQAASSARARNALTKTRDRRNFTILIR